MSMNILLVDDNEDYLMLLREALALHGYTVHTATDGIEGCEVLSRRSIDLIISDVRMPRRDGLQMHALVRRMERYKNTKFIFVSGVIDACRLVRGLDPSVDFFLDKTTPLMDFMRVINNLCTNGTNPN